MNSELITAVRQNHALEHATINILVARLGASARLVGRTTTTGFYIYGDIPTQVVEEAATEGLARLQKGESELALSPLCGTNIVVAGILAGISSAVVLRGKNRLQRLPGAILAAMGAVLVAQPIGRLAQKYLTTSAELGSMRIARVTRKGSGLRAFHKVETIRSDLVQIDE